MNVQTTARSYKKSAAAFQRASALMPGGVSSPVRAFKAVGRNPVTVRSGKGATLTDVDGNQYVDYVMSYGPLILGHCPDVVAAALTKTAKRGTSFGMSTELESTLAEMIVKAMPSVDLVRFVNSGTEACMSAIRLARAATGREKVIKCVGCYHGHSDGLLVEAGSGATTLGTPSSPGITQAAAAQTVLVPYNDLEATKQAFEQHAGQIACMAVEPIAGNMGCIPPAEGYLQGLRQLCDAHGTLLLFDEVMSGFRVAPGGAQALYGVTPDLTCLGKVVGGGLPCAVYGGREDLMRQVAPDGPVYQAGTLSGNPLAMAAGIATLGALFDEEAGCYELLDKQTATLAEGLTDSAEKTGCALTVQRVGSMLCPFFTDRQVTNYTDATSCDLQRFAAFFGAMLDEGVMLAPSQFEAWFVGMAHDEEAVDLTVQASAKAFEAAAGRLP